MQTKEIKQYLSLKPGYVNGDDREFLHDVNTRIHKCQICQEKLKAHIHFRADMRRVFNPDSIGKTTKASLNEIAASVLKEQSRRAKTETPKLNPITSRRVYTIHEPSDIKGLVPVMPLALDNQMLTREVEERIYADPINNSLTSPELSAQITGSAILELKRALINSPLTVIQRAAFQNSAALLNIYKNKSDRRSLESLLNNQNIYVYLYNELTPDQRPAGYTTNSEQLDQWISICRNTDVTSLKFSKDDERNKDGIIRLADSFAAMVMQASSGINIAHALAKSLNPQRAKELTRYIIKALPDVITDFNLDQMEKTENERKAAITREELYKKLVIRDNTNAFESRIDPNKPFSREIKRLIDCCYTNNLPMALGIHSLSPAYAMSRTDLIYAMMKSQQEEVPVIEIAEIQESLKQIALDKQVNLKIPANLDIITLTDIVELRGTDEWIEYSTLLQRMAASASITEVLKLTGQVSAAHDRLGNRIVKMKRIAEGKTMPVSKTATIQFNAGGGQLTLAYTADKDTVNIARNHFSEASIIGASVGSIIFSNSDMLYNNSTFSGRGILSAYSAGISADLEIFRFRTSNTANFLNTLKVEADRRFSTTDYIPIKHAQLNRA
ncbi:MAG: hypothetical protein LBQ68_00760 [Clostridiales bacterium]|nr:hypothetical protein [Clostridiales bacterium]